jgi:hypothetical protein
LKEEHLYYFGEVVNELKKSKNQWETEYITRICDIIIRQGYFDRINYNYEAFPSFSPNYMTESDIIRDKQMLRLSKIIGIVIRGYNKIIQYDIRANNLIIYFDNFVKENPHKFDDENNVTYFLTKFEKFIKKFEKKLKEEGDIYARMMNQLRIDDERGKMYQFATYIH